MSKAGRIALILLGVVLLLPGACSVLGTPFLIGLVMSLFSKNPEEFAMAAAGTAAWAVSLGLGLAGLWLLRKFGR